MEGQGNVAPPAPADTGTTSEVAVATPEGFSGSEESSSLPESTSIPGESGSVSQLTGVSLAEGNDVPEWMKVFDGSGAPVTVTAEELDALPMEGKKAVHAMYAELQAERAKVAEAREQIATNRRTLSEENISLKSEQSKLYDIFADPRLKAFLEPPDGDAPDPYSAEGIQHTAKETVSQILGEFMKTMQDVASEADQARESAVLESRREARRAELKAFVAEHSDFGQFREDISRLVKEHNMPAEDAYLFIKAKKGLLAPESGFERNTATEASRANARRLSSRGGSRTDQSGFKFPTGNAVEIAQQLQNDPELQKRILEKMRNGFGR